MFSIGVDISEFTAAIDYMDRMVDRACMYAIRQAGREIRTAARATVPVRTGRLQKSISNARRIRTTGDHEFTLSVGPHGAPMFMYSGKIEGEHPYMSPARDAIEGRMGDIFEQAQAKVLAKFR